MYFQVLASLLTREDFHLPRMTFRYVIMFICKLSHLSEKMQPSKRVRLNMTTENADMAQESFNFYLSRPALIFSLIRALGLMLKISFSPL